ncbi:galactose oxidase [Polyporus arcularius HHB13444]|uniref:Galactose oxidase n=1 Tax=Polyporus arcularius HHB13444 TaxID=1314778 RepID=A0A5C3PB42_9APHY|nr:galactose oxidase [Polyporus arcularius HHB13444]
MLWCNTPPLLRRITNKKSYSDLSIVRKVYLSRGNSKQSDRTLVDIDESKLRKFKSTSEVDVVVIDAPPLPPPKDNVPRSPPPPLTPKSATSETSFKDKPLPTPVPEPEDDSCEPSYPWYCRRLLAPDNTSRYAPSQPAVFPRSDFALSTSGSTGSGLNLFGGLVGDRAKNDVYTISVKDRSVTRLYTIGDIPQPRYGHASAYAGSVVVVWGGDIMSASSNPIRARAKYDNGLYFLNLVTREWTRVSVDGPAPAGRIGHSVVMIGPRIYIFGGEANGEYFNDVWCFDLSTLVSKPAWEQIELPKGCVVKPSKRSGHTCVPWKEHLLVFGGTDGKYHYNDTWAFDTATKTWSEVSSTGYIPSPREGHAAALVGDVMYIFGGRGVDGANMGQLAAYKISSKRWFMFQNMGPEPLPRSGHGMAAVGSKVYVIGGVSEDQLSPNGKDSNVMYILETNSIKYPTTKFSAPQAQTPVP